MDQSLVFLACFSLWTGVQPVSDYARVRLEQYCGETVTLVCPDADNQADRAGTLMFLIVPIENCSVNVQTPNACSVNHALYFNLEQSELAMGDSIEIYENVQPGSKGTLVKKIPGGTSPRNHEPDSVAQLLTSYNNQQRLSFNLHLEPKDMINYSHEVLFHYTIVRKQSQPGEGYCRALDGYIPTDIICTNSGTYGRINCPMTYLPSLGITNRAFRQQSCIRKLPDSYTAASISSSREPSWPTPVPSLSTPVHYIDYFQNDTSNLTTLDRLFRRINTGCGGIIAVTSTSPGLLRPPTETDDSAGDHAFSVSCIWMVINLNGGQMKFTQDSSSKFEMFECSYDRLVINGTAYCNSNPFTDITISASVTVAVFKSDQSIFRREFAIKIEAETSHNATLGTPALGDMLHISNDTENETPAALDWQNDDWQLKQFSIYSGCGGIVTATTTSAGYMKSPVDESGKYPPHAFCIWLAQAPDGMRLELTQENSSTFDIAEDCDRDKLDIAGMEFCKHRPLHNLTLPFSKTVAVFESDYFLGGKGFNIKVAAIE